MGNAYATLVRRYHPLYDVPAPPMKTDFVRVFPLFSWSFPVIFLRRKVRRLLSAIDLTANFVSPTADGHVIETVKISSE